ncbi:MAG TPA: MATE family efflux transporter, partial [Erysipelotrichaceae bacterium]|nr:MATE family efflux transporter [Erysipelotrichaceae bacterium]
MQRDLTKGNLLKNIVVFSLPFLLSYFLQTLYGMADLFIVGQFDGASVISGVAIGSQVMHMITVMLVGVATGGAVMIGRYVGAHDKENISKTIGNTITLFVIIAAILTALLLLLVSPIVTIMSTPKEAIVETSNYLKICFIGIP